MDARSPLVSVIIPTYNRPNFLRRAIESVKSQTYENIEIIVVDDCPSEPVEDIIKTDSDGRIKYTLHDENRGVCGARNTGIKESKGKFLAFLDDDDTWENNKIKKQIDVFESELDPGLVYTGSRLVDDSGNTLSVSQPATEGDVTKQLLLHDFVSFSSILVNRTVVEKAGHLDENLTNWEDWEWCIRLSRHTDFGVVEAPLVTSYRGEHEMRSDNFEQKRDVGFDRFIEKVEPVAAQYGKIYKNRFYGNLHYHLGYSALSNGYYQDAAKNILDAIKYWPFNLDFYLYFILSLLGDNWYGRIRTSKRWVVNKLD